MTCACPVCAGVFIARGKEDALVTQSIVPGETVYGEKKVLVEVSFSLCLSVCLSVRLSEHWHCVCCVWQSLCDKWVQSVSAVKPSTASLWVHVHTNMKMTMYAVVHVHTRTHTQKSYVTSSCHDINANLL